MVKKDIHNTRMLFNCENMDKPDSVLQKYRGLIWSNVVLFYTIAINLDKDICLFLHAPGCMTEVTDDEVLTIDTC